MHSPNGRTLAPSAGVLIQAQAFVFDLDGTILDSEKYHTDAFARAMQECTGYQISAAEKRESLGSTSMTFAAKLANRHKLLLSPGVISQRKNAIMSRTFRAELFPAALRFLNLWDGRIPMAIATNSRREFAEYALRQVNLLDRFEAVVTMDDAKAQKPDPEIIRLAVARLQSAAERTLVFEDTLIGSEAAKNAGCPVVLVQLAPVPFLTWSTKLYISSWPELCEISQEALKLDSAVEESKPAGT